MTRIKRAANPSLWLTVLAASLFAIASGGCAAVAVGAGAAGAIAYTDRGAKGSVKGDATAVNQDAKAVFKEMGIKTTATKSEDSGRKQELKGKSANADVTVEITTVDHQTSNVEVIAQENTVKWNKDYAKKVLSNIVAKG